MKSFSKTVQLLLLGLLLAGCGTALQSKKDEPTPEQLKQAEAAALRQQEYEAVLATMRLGDYPAAITQFTAFIERHPGLAGPYANIGILYHKMNRPEEAEQALSRAVALNPGNAVAQNRLGMVYREMGRFNDALVAYNRAIAADEKYADPYLNLGILHDLYLLDGKKALEFYNQYQKMTGGQDGQVTLWITELKQRSQQPSHAGENK